LPVDQRVTIGLSSGPVDKEKTFTVKPLIATPLPISLLAVLLPSIFGAVLTMLCELK